MDHSGQILRVLNEKQVFKTTDEVYKGIVDKQKMFLTSAKMYPL